MIDIFSDPPQPPYFSGGQAARAQFELGPVAYRTDILDAAPKLRMPLEVVNDRRTYSKVARIPIIYLAELCTHHPALRGRLDPEIRQLTIARFNATIIAREAIASTYNAFNGFVREHSTGGRLALMALATATQTSEHSLQRHAEMITKEGTGDFDLQHSPDGKTVCADGVLDYYMPTSG